MTKKDILQSLKELKDESFFLCMQKKTITEDEFEKFTGRLYKGICRLEKEVGEDKKE